MREDRLFAGTAAAEPMKLEERLLALVDAGGVGASASSGARGARRSGWAPSSTSSSSASRSGARRRGARALEALRRLASVLGAHLIVEEGDDPAEVVARVARERGTTYVLVAAPPVRRGLGALRTPLPMRIVQALPEVDVRIVADRTRAAR